jgi:hypothetical protein
MKRMPYLLVALLLCAQFDDAWVAAPVSSSAAVVDDSDNYLPAQRRPREEPPASLMRPAFASFTGAGENLSIAPGHLASELSHALSPAPATLCTFMSLQI